MSDPRAHPLFWRFPIAGTVAVAGGELPQPYHVYNGHSLLITGHGAAGVVTRAFAGQDVFPVLTGAGRAAMGLFMAEARDASLGPHLHLQVMALCAPTPGQTIAGDATAVLAAMVMQPDLGLFNLQQWSDSAAVVAFRSGHLGQDTAGATGQVTLDKRLRFSFRDADGAPLATADLRQTLLSNLGATLALIRRMGLHPVLRMARQPFALTHLVTRKTALVPRNLGARSITAADRRVITRFDPKRDRMTLSGPLAAYDFQPLCLEHTTPYRCVHLAPGAPA